MRNVRLARLAFLTLVGFRGEVVGVKNNGYLLGREVDLDFLDQAVQAYGALPGGQTSQDGSGVIHG